FFLQAEDGIRDPLVTGVQTCALPIFSKAGIASRTITREWIEQGRVKVNGRVVRNPDHWVESTKDVVHLDGLRVREEKKIYIALNKPTGVITSFGDARNRPTVYDYLKGL